jgi:hypothetical protein
MSEHMSSVLCRPSDGCAIMLKKPSFASGHQARIQVIALNTQKRYRTIGPT